MATSVGGVPEVVEDGRSGFLTGPGDTAAMADRVLELVGDPGRAQEMGNEGLRVARERFSRVEVVDRYESVYREVLERPGSGGVVHVA